MTVTMSREVASGIRREATLADRYDLERGTVLLTGVQALVRLMVDQRRADGPRAGAFVSGYQGSPLGGLDLELGRVAAAHGLTFTPGLNEELAATAVAGSQLAPGLPGARAEGVTGYWYGKSPGLDRAMDALRHANFAGTHPHGGAVALVGDDPSCKSSTLPSAAEATLAALGMPTFFPGSPQEVLDLGRHAIACSRVSGLWSALKVVADVADGAGTVTVGAPFAPALPPSDYVHRPDARLLGAGSLAAERTLFGERTALAQAYVAANVINVVRGPRHAWLGIVAAGHVAAELRQALADVGVADLDRAGIRLLQVGALFPHDGGGLRAFAAGLDEVLVVEEKLPFLETALRDALYDTARPPRIVGRRDERGAPLVPVEGALDADVIALAVARRLGVPDAPGEGVAVARDSTAASLGPAHAPRGGAAAPPLAADLRDAVAARVALVHARRAAAARGPLPLARTPAFCSGCPHATSTVAAGGDVVGAGIGCHTMVLLAPEGRGTLVGLTPMGGEGAQFAGIAPFTDTEHFVQNVGDGTFHHSASLAIRFAVAAGLNITYKLLHNGAVAMTGGQDVVGRLPLPELTRWLELEGVRRIVVTAEDPSRWRAAPLARCATVRPRGELAAAQAELAAVPGVTVLLHDQQCAAELRRLRRRGRAPEAARRIVINERVCEGCGDCGRKSACPSVEPVDTELGRKTRIDQASCNGDTSCVAGDCPSFVEVVPAAGRRRPLPGPPDCVLPEPERRVGREAFAVRMPGVGGTGVVTVSQVLQTAALLDGLHVSALDQTGLAQKGGPVVSDVRITAAPQDGANHAVAGGADLLLGLDLLGAARPRELAVADPLRTYAVLNTHRAPTAAMVVDPSVRLGPVAREIGAVAAVTRCHWTLDATAIADALFGDRLPVNTIMLGAAYQAGCLPVAAAAIEAALRLNGAAVQLNMMAFAWGRAAIADPVLVARRVAGPAPAPPGPAARAIVADALGAAAARRSSASAVLAGAPGGELRRLLEIRVEDLVGYQDAALARSYAEEVAAVARVEAARGAPGETAVAEAFARQLHRLLAAKDEYEVARLHLDAIETARREVAFGADARVHVLLQPPLLRALGVRRKVRAGRWARPAFRALVAARGLRGTALDPFGHTALRRLERELPGEYRALVARALAHLTPATHAQVAAIAALPELIRGYEDVKLDGVARFREQAAAAEGALSERA